MATLEAMRPYVEQFFDDPDIQQQLSRAGTNLRKAKARAGRAKSTKQALQDEHLRDRLFRASRNVIAAGAAIQQAPRKRKRRRRGRLLTVVVLAAGGAWVYQQIGGRDGDV
jgi:hypothetical protein